MSPSHPHRPLPFSLLNSSVYQLLDALLHCPPNLLFCSCPLPSYPFPISLSPSRPHTHRCSSRGHRCLHLPASPSPVPFPFPFLSISQSRPIVSLACDDACRSRSSTFPSRASRGRRAEAALCYTLPSRALPCPSPCRISSSSPSFATHFSRASIRRTATDTLRDHTLASQTLTDESRASVQGKLNCKPSSS